MRYDRRGGETRLQQSWRGMTENIPQIGWFPLLKKQRSVEQTLDC